VDTLEILVTGMTCDHCARAVREEVGALPGVSAVDVDVAAGKVVITGSPLPGPAALGEAIAEAGYALAG
jgi:copper chaperone CopZ